MKIRKSIRKLLNRGFEEAEKKRFTEMLDAIEENNTEKYFSLMPDTTSAYWKKY